MPKIHVLQIKRPLVFCRRLWGWKVPSPGQLALLDTPLDSLCCYVEMTFMLDKQITVLNHLNSVYATLKW